MSGFVEGHKRETRKSYQAYIEEISTGIKTEEPKGSGAASMTSDDASDDYSRRRSKRTPVPKRNFKLIDDFQSGEKEPPKKKGRRKLSITDNKQNTEQAVPPLSQTNVQKEEIPSWEEEIKIKESHLVATTAVSAEIPETSVTPANDLASTVEEIKNIDETPPVEEGEDEEETAPRKSGRVRKPKQFKDSVTPSYIKKSVERSLKTAPDESSSQSIVEIAPTDDSIASVEETPKQKKRGRKKKDKTESVVTTIKQEVLTDVSQPNDHILETPQPKILETPRSKKQKRSSSTSGPGKPHDTSTSSESEFSVKFKPSRRSSKSKDDSTAVEEESETPRKSAKKDKKKEGKRSSTTKLVVSFKKKPSDKKTSNVTERETVSVKEETYIMEPIVHPTVDPTSLPEQSSPIMDSQETIEPQEEPLAITANKTEKHPKKSKKKKEKTKKKLNSKNQKVIDVQTFPVADGNIVRVKKKKIYKKRSGTKVLVRIIKNHCNTAGEIVKTETIAVDNVPVEEDSFEVTPTEEITSPLQDESMNISFKDEIFGDENLADNEEHTPSEVDKKRKKKPTFKIQQKINSKANTQQQKVSAKKGTKLTKKTLSRPANKNVTRGGKVVGKTTKGIKTTGEAAKGSSKQVKNMCPCCTGKLLKITGPIISPSRSSDPKNAYNLFCRKYRPIIVQNHPKADFSEISRRLASIWNNASDEDKKEYNDMFNQLTCAFKAKLTKLNRVSPTCWTEAEFKYIKKAISHDLPFASPQYSVTRLQPVDMAAHLQLLGDSLTVIGGALQQQSAMTVHGAMSVLLDSILCALAPLLFLTSQVPEMKAISDEDQAKTLDNLAYILPGL